MSLAISAVYQPQPEADWQRAEIVADHPSGGLVLREVGKFYRGVFVVPRERVRLSGPEFVSGAQP